MFCKERVSRRQGDSPGEESLRGIEYDEGRRVPEVEPDSGDAGPERRGEGGFAEGEKESERWGVS